MQVWTEEQERRLAPDMGRLTYEEARYCVASVNAHMQGARAGLLRLYEAEGWRVLGYASWRECVVAEFGQSQATLYRQLQAAQIEAHLSHIEKSGTIPYQHLRHLAVLPDEHRAEVYQEAVSTAPPGGITAAHVAQTVEHFRPPDHHAVHYASESPEWYTPRSIIDAVIGFFDAIDLDPCSNSAESPNVPAARHLTQTDDGLHAPWFGRVYMNPPYGREIGPWVRRAVNSYESREIEAAILLVPARTDTEWFRRVRDFPVCFVNGRVRFIGPDGEGDAAPFPSALVYLGDELDRFAAAFAHLGDVWVRHQGGRR